MSLADKTYINMCKEIIDNGTSTEGQEVRPVWPDTGEKAHTIKAFGICNKYDLRKEFPIITLRPINIYAAYDEILWIYQKKSNKISDLSSHIWDAWSDENGTIGKAYGYQIGQLYPHHMEKFDNGKEFQCYKDQMDGVLYDLKHNPFSRRIMTNMYNFDDLNKMQLYPCAYSTTWNVTDEGYDKLVLNMVLNQRSQDVLTAGSWNVVQYALLLMMVAQVVDMIPGQLVHMIADAHIYDRHIPIIKELITRETHDAPIVSLNTDIKDFYEFDTSSLYVDNYISGAQVKNIPVAV